MSKIAPTGIGFAVDRFDAHLLHQPSHPCTSHCRTMASQHLSQHPSSRKRLIEVKPIHRRHQCQVRIRDWRRRAHFLKIVSHASSPIMACSPCTSIIRLIRFLAIKDSVCTFNQISSPQRNLRGMHIVFLSKFSEWHFAKNCFQRYLRIKSS